MKYKMKYPKTLEDSLNWNYKYWDRNKDFVGKLENENLNIIEPELKNYEWITKDINENKLSKFLTRHYISLNEPKRVFSENYLKWCHSFGEYVGIIKDDKIYGYIFYIKSSIQIEDVNKKSIDVKILCVDEEIRNKGFMIKLIEKVKCINKDYDLGTFESKMYIRHPISKITKFLKILKVNDITKNLVKVSNELKVVEPKKNEKPTDRTFVKIDESNIDKVYEIYKEYLDKFMFHDEIDKETFKKMLINNFVKSYCILKNGEIIDYFSYYRYSVYIKNNKLKIGKIWMYSCVNDTIYYVMKSIIGNIEKCDMIELCDIMDSEIAIVDYGFTGKLTDFYTYLYGWRTCGYENKTIYKMII